MNNKNQLGTIIQIWYDDKLINTFIATKIQLGSLLGVKYAFMNVNGQGVLYKYYDTLDELFKSISGSQGIIVLPVSLHNIMEEIGIIREFHLHEEPINFPGIGNRLQIEDTE